MSRKPSFRFQLDAKNGFTVRRCELGEHTRIALAKVIHREQLGLRFGSEVLRQRYLGFRQTQPIDQQIARDME